MPDFNQLFALYKDHLIRTGKSDLTRKAYLADLAYFAAWPANPLHEHGLTGVSSRDIQAYRDYQLRLNLSTATINRRLNSLTGFFRWAKLHNLVADSPFALLENVSIRQAKEPAPRWLDGNEQTALLRVVYRGENRRDIALVQTLLGTGLRIAEAADLTVADLDISERKGWLRVKSGKGNKARDIPLDKKTRQALADYLAERVEDGSNRLFLGQRGPMNPPGIHYLILKYAYQAHLEDCTAHTLRHTFAKNLVDTGTPLDQVAMLLGHESLDTTKIYTRPGRVDLERAVQRAAGEI